MRLIDQLSEKELLYVKDTSGSILKSKQSTLAQLTAACFVISFHLKLAEEAKDAEQVEAIKEFVKVIAEL